MNIRFKIPAPVRDKFRFGTLSFIFIVAYINVFQLIFGPENSIVGVIFTIMMSASMARDLTAAPVRHLIAQSLVLVWMALAAYWVNALPMPMSFMINFVTLLGILYAFTYEYSSHLYFPYILSYLFLIYISPVSGAQLPRRLMAMLAGAVSIMLYQWFMGRKRVVETAKDVLCGMVDMISHYIDSRLEGGVDAPDFPYMRSRLYQLSRTVYERRKRILCISDASFYMVDAGRGLEHLLVLINELPAPLCRNDRDLLINVRSRLAAFHSFLQQETGGIPLIDSSVPAAPESSKTSVLFQNSLNYIRDRLLHMTDPQNRSRYRETSLSFRFRLMAALDLSPVRAVYALRTALVLSAAACLVQALGMPHGRWLLFTLASVSLPYADDVPAKTKKRILATITGGLASVVIYSLVHECIRLLAGGKYIHHPPGLYPGRRSPWTDCQLLYHPLQPLHGHQTSADQIPDPDRTPDPYMQRRLCGYPAVLQPGHPGPSSGGKAGQQRVSGGLGGGSGHSGKVQGKGT